MSEDDEQSGRRALLAKLGLVGLGACIAGPTLAALVTSPASGGSVNAALGAVDRFAPNSATRVTVVADRADAWMVRRNVPVGSVWVVRDAQGEFTVLSTVCPHLGCGTVASAEGFVCPCHNSNFSRDGARDPKNPGPAPRGLDKLEHRVVDGALWCTWTRFKPGIPERVEVA